ncbi:unnamed protein product [Rangifer tarandus platyrhynchus]|uniref:Uncharacterized protein n=1 Tax=Rangifer tarandus platyrhynchus TaxID=3082113 RepID=A0ABN8YQV3_RANTA|nr:unnamed protein product [Rangifer tarandus platyrhynchus]
MSVPGHHLLPRRQDQRLVWVPGTWRRVGEVIRRLQSRGSPWGPVGSKHGQATEDCCFRPSFPIPGLIFLCPECLLSPAGCFACALPQGALLCATPFLRGKALLWAAGRAELGVGRSEGPVCEGRCSPCLRLSRLLWLLFLCGYLLQVALCQTHSVTRVHTRLPTWTHSPVAFQSVEVGEPVILGVKFAMTGWGGVGVVEAPWFTEEADKGLG